MTRLTVGLDAKRHNADYGVDAPVANTILLLAGGTAVASSLIAWATDAPRPFGPIVRTVVFLIGANLLLVSLGLLWYSIVVKRRLRDRLLATIPWRGDETVLDIGCGRGLWLMGAAQRLTTGRAIGVDLWRLDLSGNGPDGLRENARLERVAERVTVAEADARRLPFADGSFDLIVSSLTLHNIRARPGREQALQEIARVLKPGGRALLLDLRHTSEYVSVLRQCGLRGALRSSVGRLFTTLFMILTWGAVRFYWVVGQKA
jgi:SAM-dependent methyltransferase